MNDYWNDFLSCRLVLDMVGQSMTYVTDNF